MILLLLTHGWGPVLGWQQVLKQHKRTVKWSWLNQLPNDSLVLVKVPLKPTANLHWQHDHEFVLNGEWFDIVRSDTMGDTLHAWCFPDRKETRLAQRLEQLVNRHYSSGHEGQKDTAHCLTLLLEKYLSGNGTLVIASGMSILDYRPFTFPHTQDNRPPPVPPPDV